MPRRRRSAAGAALTTAAAILFSGRRGQDFVVAFQPGGGTAFRPSLYGQNARGIVGRRQEIEGDRLAPRNPAAAASGPMFYADANVDETYRSRRGFGGDNKGRRQSNRSNNRNKRGRKRNKRKSNRSRNNNNSCDERALRERHRWLHRATVTLLDPDRYPPGSLGKGKWHEVESMMVAWSKVINDGTYSQLASQADSDDDDESVAATTTNINTPPLVIEGLLKRLIDERAAGTEGVEVTTDTYNLAIDAWAAAAAAAAGTDEASQDSDNNNHSELSTGKKKKSRKGAAAAARRAQEILRFMQRTYESTGDDAVRPNSKSFLSTLGAWTRVAASSPVTPGPIRNLRCNEAARAAHGLVLWMETLFDSGKNDEAEPSMVAYSLAMDAFAKSGERDAGTKAEGLLRHMQSRAREERGPESEGQRAEPNTFCYNIVINAYTRQGRRGGAIDSAERILTEMENRCSSADAGADDEISEEAGGTETKAAAPPPPRPDVVSYTSVISAWARANRKGYGATRAENILDRMESIADKMEAKADERARRGDDDDIDDDEQQQQPCVRPNTITYNAVLKAWSRSDDARAPERAERLLRRMELQFQSGNDDVRPDRISFNTLIHTLSKAGEVTAAQRAEDILLQMERHAEEGREEWGPNLFSYNSVIEGWAKVVPRGRPEGAARAYSVLRRLIARSNHHHHQQQQQQHHRTDAAGSGDERRRQQQQQPQLRPDTFSYNSVIFALSRASGGAIPDAAERAEEILVHMERAREAGNDSVKADVFGYSSAISAWSRSGKKGAGYRADALLERMERMAEVPGREDLRPNTITFNCVIDAWAKSGEGTLGARRAESLLHRMEDMYVAGDGTVKPSAHTYNSVLSAWARSGTKCAHRKAEGLVDRMWELYESGNSDVRPDGCSFNTLINAVSKSQREGKAQKALRILRRMDKLYRAGYKYARPNEFTYTSVLNSCAFTYVGDDLAKRKALDTAIFTLGELQESHYGSPNHVTYGTFLKACANLMETDDERWRVVVEPVFLQCCRDGCVSGLVLSQLRHAAPADLYNNLLGEIVDSDGAMVKMQDLPVEWRCNVGERRRWRDRGNKQRGRGSSNSARRGAGQHRGKRNHAERRHSGATGWGGQQK